MDKHDAQLSRLAVVHRDLPGDRGDFRARVHYRALLPAFKFSLIHAGLGDKERAFELLEEAYENREFPMAILKVAEILGGLRDDPRFDDLLRRIGLEP